MAWVVIVRVLFRPKKKTKLLEHYITLYQLYQPFISSHLTPLGVTTGIARSRFQTQLN